LGLRPHRHRQEQTTEHDKQLNSCHHFKVAS
jgi:hypothetical protein